MLIDNELTYSDKQSLSAGDMSENIVDITKAGEALPTLILRVSVELPVSGTLGVDFQTSDSESFSSPVTLVSVAPASAASIAAAKGVVYQGHLPYGIKRFSRVKYGGTAAGCPVSAFLTGDVPIRPVN